MTRGDKPLSPAMQIKQLRIMLKLAEWELASAHKEIRQLRAQLAKALPEGKTR